MKKSTSKSFLVNRDAKYCLLLLVVQQAIVALSTVALISATRLVTDEGVAAALFWLAIFAALLILVYLPNAASTYFLHRWWISSFDTYTAAVVQNNFNQPQLLHRGLRRKYEPWIVSQAQKIYEKAAECIYQFVSSVFNSILNILVIGLMLSPQLLGYYSAAVVVLVIGKIMSNATIKTGAQILQIKRNRLTSILLKAWPNIMLGNRYNYQIWKHIYNHRLLEEKHNASRYELVKASISGLVVSAAFLVITYGNWQILQANISNLSMSLALIVTFPRQLQIIQSGFQFFNLFVSWQGIEAQVRSMDTVFDIDFSFEVEKLVDFSNITFSFHDEILQFKDLEGFVSWSQGIEVGRCTIRGANASGKSVLLSYMKRNVFEKAFLLPAQFSEICFCRSLEGQSTGYQLLTALKELLNDMKDIKVFFLDEWDANLDEEKRRLIDNDIDVLASRALVFEVLHRYE